MGWAMAGLVWPHPLHIVRDVLVAPSALVLVGWVLVLALAILSGRRRAAWASLMLMLAAHAAAMPVVLDGYLLGARCSYPAIVGLGMWAACVVPLAPRTWLLTVLSVAALSIHAVDSRRWESNLTLFDHVDTAAHGSGLAWHLYAVANLEAARFDEAGRAADHALASDKPFPGDETLQIIAWVSAREPRRAFEAAESGTKDDLGTPPGLVGTRSMGCGRARRAGRSCRCSGLPAVLMVRRGSMSLLSPFLMMAETLNQLRPRCRLDP